MSTQTDYTAEEWQLLSSLPPLIGAAVAAIDHSGIVGTFKEMKASMNGAMRALTHHKENELIQALVKKEVTNFKEAMQAAQEQQQQLIDRARAAGGLGPEQVAALAIEDAAKVAAILAEKGQSEEAADYKNWACSIGEAVASAAKEGGTFGLGAGSISEKEEALLGQIREALGC